MNIISKQEYLADVRTFLNWFCECVSSNSPQIALSFTEDFDGGMELELSSQLNFLRLTHLPEIQDLIILNYTGEDTRPLKAFSFNQELKYGGKVFLGKLEHFYFYEGHCYVISPDSPKFDEQCAKVLVDEDFVIHCLLPQIF